jgi:DNA-binding response OmpR family regulator
VSKMMVKNKYRILIIDDDPNIRILIKKRLEALDCESFEADNVASGKMKTQSIIPHLIFLDINLSDSDGFNYLAWKREIPSLQNCAVIMISADSFSKNIKHSLALGANDFIAKPFVAQAMVNKVKKILSQRKKYEVCITPPIATSCLVEATPLNNTPHTIVLDSSIRLAKSERVTIRPDRFGKHYRRMGHSIPLERSVERCTLTRHGDDPGFIDHPDSRQIQGMESILMRLHPKIYLLDDDQNFTALIKKLFIEIGIKIIVFNNANNFLENTLQNNPNLCIVDLSIKELNDSFTMIEELKRLRPELPLIIATGNTDGAATAHALDLGASDFIYKPIKHNTMIQKISDTLAESKVTSMLNMSGSKLDINIEQLELSVQLTKLDNRGIYFTSRSLFKKWSEITLESNEFNASTQKTSINLVVTSVIYDRATDQYQNYGVFKEMNTRIISKLLDHFLSRQGQVLQKVNSTQTHCIY